jgi:hypothetical protein
MRKPLSRDGRLAKHTLGRNPPPQTHPGTQHCCSTVIKLNIVLIILNAFLFPQNPSAQSTMILFSVSNFYFMMCVHILFQDKHLYFKPSFNYDVPWRMHDVTSVL